MIRAFYIILFAACKFLPVWVVAAAFILSYVILSLLWQKKVQEVEREMIFVIPALCLSYFIVPYFIFLYCSWAVLILMPVTSGIFPRVSSVSDNSRFFDKKNIILIAVLVVLAYAAATLSNKSLFHIKRPIFSILYGFAAFGLAFIRMKRLNKPSFSLFYIPAILLSIYIISLFDLKFHAPIDKFITGFLVAAALTMLFYLLDMIPKKYFWWFLVIQFCVYILFGNKIYILLAMFFIIQNFLVFSYRASSPTLSKPYQHITRPTTLLHFLLPTVLAVLYIFVGKRYVSEIYPLLLGSFVFSLYFFYRNHLYTNIIQPKLIRYNEAIRTTIQFVFFNLILGAYFVILHLLGAATWKQMVLVMIAGNIVVGAHEYLTRRQARQTIYSEQTDIMLFNIFPVFILFLFQQFFGIFR